MSTLPTYIEAGGKCNEFSGGSWNVNTGDTKWPCKGWLRDSRSQVTPPNSFNYLNIELWSWHVEHPVDLTPTLSLFAWCRASPRGSSATPFRIYPFVCCSVSLFPLFSMNFLLNETFSFSIKNFKRLNITNLWKPYLCKLTWL